MGVQTLGPGYSQFRISLPRVVNPSWPTVCSQTQIHSQDAAESRSWRYRGDNVRGLGTKLHFVGLQSILIAILIGLVPSLW